MVEQQLPVDIMDHLAKRTTQLRALTDSLSGESFDSFRGLEEETQRALIWLAYDLAVEIDETLRRSIVWKE